MSKRHEETFQWRRYKMANTHMKLRSTLASYGEGKLKPQWGATTPPRRAAVEEAAAASAVAGTAMRCPWALPLGDWPPRWLGVKTPAANAGDPGSIPGSGRSPGEGMATHSSLLAQEIWWVEEPAGYSPWGHRRVGPDLVAKSQQLRLTHLLGSGTVGQFLSAELPFFLFKWMWGLLWGSVVRTRCFHSWGPGSKVRFHKPRGEAKNKFKKLKQVCVLWGDTSKWCKYWWSTIWRMGSEWLARGILLRGISTGRDPHVESLKPRILCSLRWREKSQFQMQLGEREGRWSAAAGRISKLCSGLYRFRL